MGYQAEFDFAQPVVLPRPLLRPARHVPAQPAKARIQRGARNYAAGRMAEDAVAGHYARLGANILEHRWRGQGGEIDLIAETGGDIIFIEVKSARSHDAAAWRLDRRQMDRICMAALEYCGRFDTGMMTPMRFDVALVDSMGRINVIENAFGED